MVVSVFKLVHLNMNLKSMTAQSIGLLPLRIEYAVTKQRRVCIGVKKIRRQENSRPVTVLLSL